MSEDSCCPEPVATGTRSIQSPIGDQFEGEWRTVDTTLVNRNWDQLAQYCLLGGANNPPFNPPWLPVAKAGATSVNKTLEEMR
jgi:hypothetical protein